jgi:hypothetical protein
MRTRVHLLAATAALCLTATGSSAMPMSAGALNSALDATNLVEKSAVYVVEGRRYCFYFDGWHGAGWYRCGYAFRRGLGWGGVYGWQGWDYGPAARRYGHHQDRGDSRFREGRRDGTTFREGTTIREKSTTRGETNFRGQFQQKNESRQGRSEGRSGSFTERSGGEVKGNMRMQADQPRGGDAGGGKGGGAPMKSGGGAQMKSGDGGGGAPGSGGAPGGGGDKK